MAFVEPGYGTFAGHLTERFVVRRQGAAPVTVRLTTVDGEDPAGRAGYGAFTVTFEGPATDPLPQGSYEFENDDAGRFLLFIVPVGRTADVVEYEAVFTTAPAP